jgi:flagellar hook-basal body complex protein FliE
MTVSFNEALAAYSRAAGQGRAAGLDSRENDGTDFAGALREATEQAVDTLKEGEAQSLKAALGTADINDVVAAMSKADLTLQTVVTLRDRVIQAYQDILRMPI